MISAELITYYFNMNYRVLHMQLEGLSQEDCLIEPPFRGNNFNWVLGHIIAGRSTALHLLGEEPVWDEEKSTPYSRDSEPITAEAAYPLEQLVNDLDATQEKLEAALARITVEELAIKKDGRTLGERLAFAYWHEAYHTGQTELLRQLAGKDDKVI